MKRSHSGRAPGDFRDQLIAASLKHGKDAAEAEANAKFPRSIDRGLIEASSASSATDRGLSFPRSIDRGLIEAGAGRPVHVDVLAFPRSIDRGLIEAPLSRCRRKIPRTFPRSIDRGLIEATPSHSSADRSGSHFRDQLIAASLKRIGAATYEYVQQISAIN